MLKSIRQYRSMYVYCSRAITALLVSLSVCSNALALQGQSPNRECATCHIMWLLAFKRQDVTALIPFDPLPRTASGKEDVVATERMCISCHDGFVLDSRWLWKNRENSHPVGQKPSPLTVIPTSEGKEIFPLNEDGNVYCGTCHSAHGIDWSEQETTIFLRMENFDSKMCIACHFEHSTGIDDGNHPINQVLEKIPASLKGVGAKFSDSNQVICQSCHRVHGAPGDNLTVLDNRESALCVSCHESKGNVMVNKHNLAVTSPQSRNLNNHFPAETGPCSACHLPHNARGPRLWARSVGVSNGDFLSSACLGCHNDRGSAENKPVGTHSHPINIPLERVGISATSDGWTRESDASLIKPLPLFDKQGNPATEGGNVTCLTCHDPHLWKQTEATGQKISRTDEEIRTTEGDGSSSFLRIANDHESAACTYCHTDKATVIKSDHDLNQTSPDSRNAAGMLVSQSGTCSACHLPHNGRGPVMWAREKTEGTGVEPQCLSCHNKNGPAAEKTTGQNSHPLHVDLTGIDAQPNLPLYGDDGVRDDVNGLVDCTTCHNPHQWDPTQSGRLTESTKHVEGDGNTSFLRMRTSSRSEDSHLCAECHRQQASVFDTDHDLAVTAPEALNNNQQTTSQSGPCGQCHSVHNAVESHRLWTKELSAGQDVPEQLCRGCHIEGGIAEAKVPDELSHPPRMVPNRVELHRSVLFGKDNEERANTPVFDQQGNEVEIGTITCLTCHNPHQWSPTNPGKGTGENLEGDTTTSFLRNPSTENFLCRDCHGEDSLFRYKYYHWSKSRAQERPRKP